MHLDVRREGADVVVLDAAQLQVKQSLQHTTGVNISPSLHSQTFL